MFFKMFLSIIFCRFAVMYQSASFICPASSSLGYTIVTFNASEKLTNYLFKYLLFSLTSSEMSIKHMLHFVCSFIYYYYYYDFCWNLSYFCANLINSVSTTFSFFRCSFLFTTILLGYRNFLCEKTCKCKIYHLKDFKYTMAFAFIILYKHLH